MLPIDKKKKINKTGDKTSQSEFSRLQAAIKRQQERNRKLQEDLQALIDIYHQRILPAEKSLIRPSIQLIENLTALFTRKTLDQEQRHVLLDWIHEELGVLRGLDPEAADTLKKRFEESLCKYLGISRDALEAQIEEYDRHLKNAELDEAFFAFMENHEEESEFGNQLSDHDEDAESAGLPSTEKMPMQEDLDAENWLKKLFRRAAQVLHPDREQDPFIREQKHHLMSTLVEARDRGDILCMLDLFNQHVISGEADIAADEYPSLVRLMEQQLENLKREEDNIAHASPMHAVLHEKFYSRQKATQKRRIESHLANIEWEYEHQTKMAIEVRTIKSLKNILEDRMRFQPEYDSFL